MKLSWKRDGIAALLLAVVLFFYGALVFAGGISWVNGSTVIGVIDPTGMAAVGLIAGIVATAVGGWIVLGEGEGLRYLTGTVGIIAVILGFAALVGENLFSTDVWYGVLATFMGSLVLLWGIATGTHARLFGAPRAPIAPHAV